ncbi:hypothetical protein [Amycolatopsis sp. EV170708-02-1]|uniref:hypothetical protein n=1 Tax=Amycolatopsis sp. EV170708-02-1 TaxID=2919322 RepID=UPI001F0C8D12|nr:hypothetical protein [Amycolatopsis sp. EV170708-02-1]UMP02446.1 hypothetical protein MJQ72_39720 [Amycolatopsis sp. EV170708-02-1]
MDEDIKGVLSHGASGPPLGIRAADIIERGGRIRRRRKRLAVAGSSLATIGVIVFGAIAVGGRGGEGPAPVQPAGPGLSTIAPSPVSPAPSESTPRPEVTPEAPPAASSAPATHQPRSTPKTVTPGRTTTTVPRARPSRRSSRASPRRRPRLADPPSGTSDSRSVTQSNRKFSDIGFTWWFVTVLGERRSHDRSETLNTDV